MAKSLIAFTCMRDTKSTMPCYPALLFVIFSANCLIVNFPKATASH